MYIYIYEDMLYSLYRYIIHIYTLVSIYPHNNPRLVGSHAKLRGQPEPLLADDGTWKGPGII